MLRSVSIEEGLSGWAMFVLLSILVLGLLIAVHELGHFLAARWLGIHVVQFAIGFGPILWRYQGKEVEYSLRALPLGGYVAFPDEQADNRFAPDDPNLLKNRPIGHRAIVMLAGVIANFLFGYVVLVAMVLLGGVAEVQTLPGARVQQVMAGEAIPARQAGLAAGDLLLRVNEQPLPAGPESVTELTRSLTANPGKPLQVTVERDGRRFAATITPDARGKIGVALSPNAREERRPPENVAEIFTNSAETYGRIATLTLSGFGQLFTGKAGVDQLSGPVGIVAVTAEAAQTNWLNLFFIASLISFNLAVLNLLPFPALDGGQLAFLLVEALRGKPLPEQVQRNVTQVGLLVLLGLGLVLIFKDSISLLG